MTSLGQCHQWVIQEFSEIFTVEKTTNPFSAVAIVQAHEQNKSHVKDDGGVIRLTNVNPELLQQRMGAGPGVAHLVGEFAQAACSYHTSWTGLG